MEKSGGNSYSKISFGFFASDLMMKIKKCLQPERVPGIIYVRPDTSDTGKTALLPELMLKLLYNDAWKDTMGCVLSVHFFMS